MKYNLAMAAAMFEGINGMSFNSVVYLLSGEPNLDLLKDPKYIRDGVFYDTNTLMKDLTALGNKVLARSIITATTDNPIGTVLIRGSASPTVVANGRATWFISMKRGTSAELTTPAYAHMVGCGTVGSDDSSDMIVENADIQLGTALTITTRRIRLIGHEQSP